MDEAFLATASAYLAARREVGEELMATEASDHARRSWVIDVCRTCGRHAKWPFCEHRDQPPPEGAWAWCEPVVVVERYRRQQGRRRSEA